jgi:hypothetical protein
MIATSTSVMVPPPPPLAVPLPRCAGEEPLQPTSDLILPRSRGRGTMQSMVEGAVTLHAKAKGNRP